MEALGLSLRSEAVLETLTQEALTSGDIEGEVLNREQVRSSLARRLGVEIGALAPADRHIDGVVEMMLDATQRFAASLSEERLCGWHAAMFPTGRSGMTMITVGAWLTDRTGPMQVVSGPVGRERVHFQAPDADRLPAEIAAFLEWFNAEQSIDPVLKAGIAHLWFVTVHPFDDGNGRIARAIADMALARSEGLSRRFYSLSSQIRRERSGYYGILEKSQTSSLDITEWLAWFLNCMGRAFDGAEPTLAAVLGKARFWESHGSASMNVRQRLVINRLLDGLEGKLTTSKWAVLARCSPDTALRDIQDLVEQGVLTKDTAGGRSTNYRLAD